MYFVYRDGRYIDVAGASFGDFLDGRLAQLPGERPTLDDWSDHLTTLFPEVRMKRFLEMRGADGGRWRRICAVPAFWTGLLYDQAALDAASDLVEGLERGGAPGAAGQRAPHRARHPVPPAPACSTWHAPPLAIAKAGLTRRALLDAQGNDETKFLEPVETILRERLLARRGDAGTATSATGAAAPIRCSPSSRSRRATPGRAPTGARTGREGMIHAASAGRADRLQHSEVAFPGTARGCLRPGGHARPLPPDGPRSAPRPHPGGSARCRADGRLCRRQHHLSLQGSGCSAAR